jgi:predicted dehydrogenase
MSVEPLRVAVLGMGWWSDVLADGMKRSDKFEIISCFTRSEDKRRAFAEKYGCVPASSYESILKDPAIEAIINTTPNNVHLETTRMAAQAGKHVFLDKPIANTVHEAQEIARVCENAGVVLSLGYQRRRESHFRWIKSEIDAGRFGKIVQAEGNISRAKEARKPSWEHRHNSDRRGRCNEPHWRSGQAGRCPGASCHARLNHSSLRDDQS